MTETTTTQSSPSLVVIVTLLVVGLVGGLGGSALYNRYVPIQDRAKQSILLESSAIIDVAKKTSPSVVSITSQSTGVNFFGYSTAQVGAGTGMVVTSDGLILTNNHVVADGTSFSVFTSNGHEYKDAKIVARDINRDIAFLRINASGLKPIVLGDSSQVVVGQEVVAIGNALGQYQNTVTHGIISGLGRPVVAGDQGGGNSESLQDLLQTDAAINPGNSGGPLVDLDGQVIGMNTAIAGSAQNIGFAIPASEIKPEIDSVKAQGKIVQPYLGVHYVSITPEFASANNLSVNDGAYVSGSGQDAAVISGSPADKAGLKDGDIITKVAGTSLDANHSLTSLIGQHKVGETVALTVLRDGKTQTINVTLAEAPSS